MSQRMPPVQYIMTGVSSGSPRRGRRNLAAAHLRRRLIEVVLQPSASGLSGSGLEVWQHPTADMCNACVRMHNGRVISVVRPQNSDIPAFAPLATALCPMSVPQVPRVPCTVLQFTSGRQNASP